MLKINNLSVEVSGKEVLSNINLEIKNGEIFALLGPNGSGKTSLIMTIMGFSNFKITSGEIFFKQKKINDMSIDERARMGLAVMFQRAPAIRGVKTRQLLELIKKGKFEIEKEAEDLNLNEFLERDINLGFSGGELKRSELIQILACSPNFILFDEPESGVDLENIALMGKAMNRIIAKDKDNAGLIITHTGYIFDYVKADNGCILVGGKLHCVGNPREILETIKKHGYEWCMTCDRKKPEKKTHKPRK